MIRHIPASEARARTHGGQETAFLDLREAGPFSEGHPLFAIPCPFSLFEARVGPLVPNRSVPVLLLDAGDGLADVAADALIRMGYSDVSVIEGGAPGWAAAGHTLYKGVNVPSKTLGELVEHLWHPKTLDPATLKAWQESGRAFEFVDCRPPKEYAKMTVPGARCLPNGEVAHRLAALDDDRPLVLTCAGRTRGIIGAAGLSRIHPGREVYALENGTQGWRLAGFELAFGNDPDPYPVLDGAAREKTRRRAVEFMADEGIPSVDTDAIRGFLFDGTRTTYLLDVRSEEEARVDPVPAFTHALSGQLVQSTDQWIGVRRARVILADDLGLRAALAAFWLRILGYEPYVALIDDGLRRIPPRDVPTLTTDPVPTCSPEVALSATMSGYARFLDVRPSEAYRAGHVAGAEWVNRSRLLQLQKQGRYLVIGDDTQRASLAALELLRLGQSEVAVVKGGHAALERAGAAIETGQRMPLSEAIDVTSFAHGRHDDDLEASRVYLDWEQGLVAQLDENERPEFHL
jgi:rhodanese-related sulfurtransferase